MTEEKKVWGVRSGRQQEFESYCIEHNCVVIGWQVGNVLNFRDKESLRGQMKDEYPGLNGYQIGNITGQVWAFANEIQSGDMVLMPRGSVIAVGEICGDYEYDESATHGTRHRRRVEWREKELSRSDLDGDLRNSLFANQTVFRVGRPQAKKRIAAVISGDAATVIPLPVDSEPVTVESAIDIAVTARGQIREYIIQGFHGHAMQDLVAAVLKAQGFTCRVSPPGPDGGVDILAGKGELGFGSPRLCVQVKSGNEKAGRPLVDALTGVMTNFHAEHGLFVSWNGFKFPKESGGSKSGGRDYLKIRFWDDEDLIDMVERYYDKFPNDIKAKLPLKQIWVLADGDSDD